MNLIQADINKHWEDVKHGLYSIKEETYEAENAKDIYDSCKNKTATLWLDKDIQPKDGFLITQVYNHINHMAVKDYRIFHLMN